MTGWVLVDGTGMDARSNGQHEWTEPSTCLMLVMVKEIQIGRAHV